VATDAAKRGHGKPNRKRKDRGHGGKAKHTAKDRASRAQAEATCCRCGNCTPGPGKNLTKCCYQDNDLAGQTFKGANLTSANFSGADLTGAQFTGATVSKACFVDAEPRAPRSRAPTPAGPSTAGRRPIPARTIPAATGARRAVPPAMPPIPAGPTRSAATARA
jgi:hypothetical protein